MTENLKNVILGFVAAAISVIFVHQTIILLLNLAGLTDRTPWSLSPVPPLGIPTLLNAIFWGGFWGSLLALLWNLLPGANAALKGLLYGWMIYLFSNCLILPLIKGQPLFYGFESNRLFTVFLILSGFATATAIIYERFLIRSKG
jgi:hypothetical protein